MNSDRPRFRYVFAAQLLLAVAIASAPLETAEAYVGPGLGVGTVIVILGFLGSLLLAVFGILWYPVKRMLRKRRPTKRADPEETPADGARRQEPGATDP